MGWHHLRLRLPPAVTALAGYLLCACILLLEPLRAQALPTCSQIDLRIRSNRATVVPGGAIVLAAKVSNTGTRTLSGIGVRLDLPTGLVGETKRAGAPLLVNGGTTAYWTGLTLKPGKRRVLKVKARACGSATPGSFPLGGAAYLVNSTNDVTCLNAATTKPSTVGGKGGVNTHYAIYVGLFRIPCMYMQIPIKASKSRAAAKHAPACSTPAPTPVGGPGYTLYAEDQRTVSGTFVGYTGAGRRALTEGEGDPRVTACQALCSGAGFTPIFYFALRRSDGACYCSHDK